MMEGFLPETEVEGLVLSLEGGIGAEKSRGGVRNLLDLPSIRDFASSPPVRTAVERVLGRDARAVKGILFDKTEGANWKVPWHQDVTITVSAKVEVDGYGPWSMKAGVLHVQPPSSVLERMISLRIHLDDCPEENGALRVIAGSHKTGKLDERAVQRIAGEGSAVVCAMQRGGLLMMRPLLIHASSASIIPGHRRVIHLDYAAAELTEGMNWASDHA